MILNELMELAKEFDILVVDDEPEVLEFLKEILSLFLKM